LSSRPGGHERSRMDAVLIIFLFALGACIGSFLNVVIYRVPRGESIVFPSSHCPGCGRAIKWYDNIPLISWLVLRGRCRSCKVRISPRYLLIELVTGVLVAGLYACYFMLSVRRDLGDLAHAWPTFIAHAALLCGLLVCSAVDIELFIVPLGVMWFCAAVGIAAAAFRPTPQVLGTISPAAVAAAVGAVLGWLAAMGMLRLGWLLPSFLDAEDKPLPDEDDDKEASVAISAVDGVNPRKEILRELLFLTPAIVLAVGGYLLGSRIPPVGDALSRLVDPGSGRVAAHVNSAMTAVLGLLVGAAWIWGIRIFGTLGFGKEAMGMGDVHILAAVGAVLGAKAAVLAFFVAPFLGLAWWILTLHLGRARRELPYGPWLATASAVVMVFYDQLVIYVDRFAQVVSGIQ